MPPVAPEEFPPPVKPAEEFIGPPTDPEEERIEVGVAIVGGGPGGLACAIKLMQLLEDEPELTEKLGEVPVAVIEKGKAPGAHLLSGANLRPAAMRELFPDLDPSEWPVYQEVEKEGVYFLTRRAALPLRPMPPNFRNHGNYVVSIAKLSRFLADKAEEKGAYVLTETVADLTQGALDYFDLEGRLPVRWELGVKEVWEVPEPLDRVIHTMGWPLRKRAKYNEFGGSFIYPMGEDKLCLGLVVGLDYTDSTLSVHDLLQELKTHPFVRKLLEGGKRVAWGAKTIPSGGYYAMPRSLSVPGMVIAGDAASMVNVPTLKGVHYAIRAGMLAAEAIVDALKREQTDLSAYDEKVRSSEIGRDLFPTRNMRQPFSKGFFVGGAIANAMLVTNGAFPGGKWEYEPDTEIPMADYGASESYPEADNELTFNKLDSVFLSGNATRDDAPNHVRVQEHVPRELAQTWVSLCPAQVYEIPDDQLANGAAEVDVHVTASNCVQCGAINAKGGRLTMPEGGDGPLYQET